MNPNSSERAVFPEDWTGRPGTVFLDSAGNPPARARPPVSLLAANPGKILEGCIFSEADRTKLHEAGGFRCGWVDYEGTFVFGVYATENVCIADSFPLPELATTRVEIGPFWPLVDKTEFISAVLRAKEYIAAGDIYQVNLSQEFQAETRGSGSLFPLYRELRAVSPAPMAAYLNLGGREILCSSPESFLTITGRKIETRPIKGTRPRFSDPERDAAAARELAASEKERAELVMITDLLRNDLGQVCEYGSVKVDAALELETLAQVHHLVSTVSGILRPEISAIGALAACFPGGSITGAPKKRAMEIIRELENRRRGIYCGAIGWISPEGDAAFNIAIRTLVRAGSRVSYQVGAGIVADSIAEMEYQETLHKAAGIRLAVQQWACGKSAAQQMRP